MAKVVLTSSMYLLREGMKSMLCGTDDIQVTGVFSGTRDLCERTSYHHGEIHVFADPVLDLNEPALHELSIRFPPLKIVVVARSASMLALLDGLQHGARGILTAESPPTCLLDAIRTINAGNAYISVELLARFCRNVDLAHACPGYEALTEREIQVFKRVAVGKTNCAIGSELDISAKTVSTHKTRLMGKLGVSTLAELVQFALSNGLIDIATVAHYWHVQRSGMAVNPYAK